MEPPPLKNTPSPPRSPAGKVFDLLSGFGLATILLLLLGLLTWFATLEQVENGLYLTLRKYFDWRSFYLIPELKGKMVPLVLPGGYWVGVLLLVNLTLGGVIRIRKGWKHAGNLISHLGIIFMLVAGGVAHHFSERGNIAIHEGETRDAAESFTEYAVEVAEIKDKEPAEIHVIRGQHIDDLGNGGSRIFRLPKLPFDLEIADYYSNAVPVSIHERAPAAGTSYPDPPPDGYYLLKQPDDPVAERNTAACYARVLHRDGAKSPPFILAGACFHPFTLKVDDRVFTFDMRKRIWPMPFAIRLDEFTAEFHPGTMKPKRFVSKITRIEDDREAKVTIQMNEPMRYEGLTYFQASYGTPPAGSGQKMYSVFEIVRNPADHWPEYSLYVVTFGMLVTFLTRLGTYIAHSTSRRKRHD